MDEREKIERLAKAMGHDVWRNDQGFTIIDGLHSDWNPWKNAADLRPVLAHIGSVGKQSQVLRAIKEAGRIATFEQGMLTAIWSPNIIADAALAVLEGDPCTK